MGSALKCCPNIIQNLCKNLFTKNSQNNRVVHEFIPHSPITNGGNISMSFDQMFSEKIEIENLPISQQQQQQQQYQQQQQQQQQQKNISYQTNDDVFDQDENYHLTHNDNISIDLGTIQDHDAFDEKEFMDQIQQLKDADEEQIFCQKIIQVFQHQYNLKDGMEQVGDNIYYNVYEDKQTKFWITQLRFSYIIETSLQKYINYISDMDLQLKIEKSIDQYERIRGNNDFSIMYLRYKKIPLMDPREFLYVKHRYFQQNNQMLEVTKSIDIPGFKPNTQSIHKTCRGVFKLSGNLVQQIDENCIEIFSYSETDLRSKVNPKLTKAFTISEVKKQIDRIRQNICQVG